MPRFYLHIRDGHDFIEDPDGSDHPDLESARAEAFDAAREILADAVRTGKILDGQQFEIMDLGGLLLATIPMKDALKLA